METAQQTAPYLPPATERSLRLEDLEVRRAEMAQRYLPVMSPEQTIERAESIRRIKQYLKEGEDYGVIPGTDKPTLLLPGAQKIAAAFGYVPDYEALPGTTEDWAGQMYGEPLFYYRTKCTLRQEGHAVGQGTGSCNSWEKKYRYRSGQRVCPQCGSASLIRGKAEYERDAQYKRRGAWLCFEKKGGCGAKYYGDDPAIMSQQVGQIANPDFADIINTVQKMADKRAYVAAVLSATGASQFFTQDMEDIGGAPDASVSDIRRQAAAVDTGGAPVGTQQAADAVRDRKLAEARQRQQDQPSAPPAAPGRITFAGIKFADIMQCFADIKPRVTDEQYRQVLVQVGGEKCAHANQLGSVKNFEDAYGRLLAIADQEVAA